VLKITGLDSQYLVVLFPKLLQALLTDVVLPAGAEDDRAGQPVPGGALPRLCSLMFFCRQVLKMTGLDSQYLVVLCPKLLQALLTALGEAALCRAVRYPIN
jgi:hypothetical protein